MTPDIDLIESGATGAVVTLQGQAQGRVCEHDGAPLVGRQARFCSAKCRSAWWDARHPRVGVVSQASEASSEPLRVRILALMHDREWWSMQALAVELRALPCAVAAKFRDLRRPEYGKFRFDRRPIPGCRAYEFRLVGS